MLALVVIFLLLLVLGRGRFIASGLLGRPLELVQRLLVVFVVVVVLFALEVARRLLPFLLHNVHVVLLIVLIVLHNPGRRISVVR